MPLCLALGFPSVVAANYAMEPALRYPGLWPWLVVLLVLAVETPVIALVGRVSWSTAALTALGANALTALLGALLHVDQVTTVRAALGVTAINFVVECPVVWYGVNRYLRRHPAADRTAWPRRVVAAALLMNVLSAPIIPGLEALVPHPVAGHRSDGCFQNLRAIGVAVLMYREDEGGLPPVADIAGLHRCVARYVYKANEAVWTCPDRTEGKYFPVFVPGPYACCDFRDKAALQGPPEKVPIVWDAEPWHHGGRFVGFLDGHIEWVKGPGLIPPKDRRNARP